MRRPSKKRILSAEQVKGLRKARRAGNTYREIADASGIKLTTAWAAINRQNYAHS